MSVDVSRRHPMELFVAQCGEHLGKGFAQRIDLPVHEHARVDGDALRRGQVGRTDERVQRTLPALKQIFREEAPVVLRAKPDAVPQVLARETHPRPSAFTSERW